MKNFFKNLISLLILGIVFFLFQTEIVNSFLQLKMRFFPCRDPISYSIGAFDERFNISKADFLKAIEEAENMWEKPLGKELFKYDSNQKDEPEVSIIPESTLKINLIYDERQEATVELKKMGLDLEDSKANFYTLKAKYDLLQAEYNKEKPIFENRVKALEVLRAQYEKDVDFQNKKGGADQKEYDRLEAERVKINEEVVAINEIQKSLNSKVANINALAVSLNRLVASLNLDVQKFNEIGEQYSGEFEEGTYVSTKEGVRIDIYQFEDRNKLVRVLAHELGHALGLKHLENPKAIMYRLNNGINKELTADDLAEVKLRCNI